MVDCDCGFFESLRTLDGAVVNGRDVRVLGARNCNREDEARARVAHKEREERRDMCERSEARRDQRIVLSAWQVMPVMHR